MSAIAIPLRAKDMLRHASYDRARRIIRVHCVRELRLYARHLRSGLVSLYLIAWVKYWHSHDVSGSVPIHGTLLSFHIFFLIQRRNLPRYSVHPPPFLVLRYRVMASPASNG